MFGYRIQLTMIVLHFPGCSCMDLEGWISSIISVTSVNSQAFSQNVLEFKRPQTFFTTKMIQDLVSCHLDTWVRWVDWLTLSFVKWNSCLPNTWIDPSNRWIFLVYSLWSSRTLKTHMRQHTPKYLHDREYSFPLRLFSSNFFLFKTARLLRRWLMRNGPLWAIITLAEWKSEGEQFALPECPTVAIKQFSRRLWWEWGQIN